MKKCGRIAAVTALLACIWVGVRAGETAPAAAAPPAAGAGAAPLTRTIKVQVKLYRDVDADSVYQAALTGIQADVRFQDTFDRRLVVPAQMQTVTLGRLTYPIALAFRTRTDLVCLVPSTDETTVRQLLGLASNIPLAPAALSLPLLLNPGQQIAIEGTVLGTRGAGRYVLVDSVNAGLGPQAPTRREVHLFWPSQAEPRIITEPGTQSFDFPCSHVKGKTDTVTVAVQELTAGQLDSQLAALQGTLESGVSAAKVYGQYSPRTVYGYARANTVLNVDFTDQVQSVLAPPPRQLSSASALRMGYAARVPVVRAFVMSGGPTVLVPDTWPTVVQEAATMIPGEQVRVHGTIVGARGIYDCVLADYLSFPETGEGATPEKPWWVNVDWKGVKQPFVFWDYGQYVLSPLPCQNAAGKFETLTVLISQFREYQVQVPPAAAGAPAPAAHGAPGAATPPGPAAPAAHAG